MDIAERRREPRLNTERDAYQVSFRLHDRQITRARLVNLSASGCGLEIQMADAGALDLGVTLEDLFLLHPELPCVPLQATIMRLLGKVPGKTSGYVLAGVEFTLVTRFVQQLIRDHVESHAHAT